MSLFRSFLGKIGIAKTDNSENPKESPTPDHITPSSEPAATPKGQDYQVKDRIAGRYEIYRILGGEGQSGMGVVYVCYDHEDRNVLALKTFQKKFLYAFTG